MHAPWPAGSVHVTLKWAVRTGLEHAMPPMVTLHSTRAFTSRAWRQRWRRRRRRLRGGKAEVDADHRHRGAACHAAQSAPGTPQNTAALQREPCVLPAEGATALMTGAS